MEKTKVKTKKTIKTKTKQNKWAKRSIIKIILVLASL